MTRPFTSSKLEVYFLPDGGKKGKDEIPMHSNATSLELVSRVDGPTMGIGDYAETIPTLRWWEIELESKGIHRDIPYFIRAGANGIVTVLWGDQPYAKHVETLTTNFDISAAFDDLFTWKMSLTSRGPLYDGTYTCEQQYGRIQTDMADGTFIERPLIHMIPLDQLIDNRFHGW